MLLLTTAGVDGPVGGGACCPCCLPFVGMAGVAVGSGKSKTDKVGKITKAQVEVSIGCMVLNVNGSMLQGQFFGVCSSAGQCKINHNSCRSTTLSKTPQLSEAAESI